MSSLNKAMIIGRLGADPEVRYTQANTAVATMSVATEERWKDKNGEQQSRTEWHRVVAWARLAEICQQYLKKGSQVYFEGPINTKEWEDQQGVKRYSTEIKAVNMVMLSSQEQGSRNNAPAPAGKQDNFEPRENFDVDNNFDDMDDDLPF